MIQFYERKIISDRIRNRKCLFCGACLYETLYRQDYWFLHHLIKVPDPIHSWSSSRLSNQNIKEFYICTGCYDIIKTSVKKPLPDMVYDDQTGTWHNPDKKSL